MSYGRPKYKKSLTRWKPFSTAWGRVVRWNKKTNSAQTAYYRGRTKKAPSWW